MEITLLIMENHGIVGTLLYATAKLFIYFFQIYVFAHLQLCIEETLNLDLDATKPVFRVSYKARLKPVSLASETD